MHVRRNPLGRSSRRVLIPAVAAATLGVVGLSATNSFGVIIYQVTTGTGSWGTAANWNPATVPNNVGDNATFNGAATAGNPAQTANRTATTDGGKTVGSITFNNDLSTFTNTIATGTGGPLTFDETGAGPATVSVPVAAGTGNNTISVAMTFNDNVVAQIDHSNASSGAGELNLTGTINGTGGFTKNGDGEATFGTGAKTYTGPTVLNGGRMRISSTASPTGTSSFTINSGGQLDAIATAGTYTLGTGTVNLNGAGPTSGPYASFPGAIRPDTGLLVGIPNAINLQSNTVVHMQATTGTSANPTGTMTFSGVVSGPGKLTFTAPGSNVDQGILLLTNANTYIGGTLVAGGIVQVSGANATLGTGDVTVDDSTSPTSIARLSISAGVLNAINDSATLRLPGGGTPGVADENFAILGAGVNESVGGLILGGVTQTMPGTYGSTASGATFQSDEYFSGTGVISLPEPASLGLMLMPALLLRRRRR